MDSILEKARTAVGRGHRRQQMLWTRIPRQAAARWVKVAPVSNRGQPRRRDRPCRNDHGPRREESLASPRADSAHKLRTFRGIPADCGLPLTFQYNQPIVRTYAGEIRGSMPIWPCSMPNLPRPPERPRGRREMADGERSVAEVATATGFQIVWARRGWTTKHESPA